MQKPVVSTPLRRMVMAAVMLLMATGACAKDHEFFALVDDLVEGEIATRVTGIPGGASVTLTGAGITETLVAGASGSVFEDLPPGTYQLTVAAPEGYICTPQTITVVLDLASPIGIAEFDCVPVPGAISFSVAGLYSEQFSLPVNLAGSTTRQLQLGNGSTLAGDIGIGSLDWSLGGFQSHICLPSSGTFTIAPGGEYSQQIDCDPVKGKLRFEVSGLFSDLYKVQVQLSGVATGSLQLGNGALDLDDIDFGNLQWNASPLSSHDCAPLTGNLVFIPGTETLIQIGCQPKPGSITATVSGATAQVNYTGPSSGGAQVGGTPVVFGNLSPGVYTLAITEPDGFDCQPASIPVELGVNENESAEFACESEQPEELVEYSIDLMGFQGSPGAVAPGTYNSPVLDNLLVAVAAIAISTIGNQTFYGTGPARLGFDGSSGYQLDALFPVASLFFRLKAIQICTINAALSSSNFMLVSYYTAAAVLLASAQITGSPGCFWLDVPATTRFVRLLGPALGFVDVHGLKLRGVLVE
ncbi:MAG TPA: prealbumin-like fold domain-containing protein [Gemmatimonadales bacterium]|nr:prealbumin-like fold domain-containing protein [Gemmatimonadales bacterium]